MPALAFPRLISRSTSKSDPSSATADEALRPIWARKTAASFCNRPGARNLEFDVDFVGAFGDEKEATGKKDQVPPAKGVCENGPERFCQFHQPFDA
jgi:hypothetical protein